MLAIDKCTPTTKSEVAHKNLSVQGWKAQVSSDFLKHDDSITHLNNSHSQYHSFKFWQKLLGQTDTQQQ